MSAAGEAFAQSRNPVVANSRPVHPLFPIDPDLTGHAVSSCSSARLPWNRLGEVRESGI